MPIWWVSCQRCWTYLIPLCACFHLWILITCTHMWLNSILLSVNVCCPATVSVDVSVSVSVTTILFLPFWVAANAKLWASAQTRSFVSVSGGGVGNSHECVAVGPWLKLGVTRSQAPHFSSDWKWTDGWMDFFAHA